MAFVGRQTDFRTAIEPYTPADAAPTQPRQGVLRRLFDAIMDSRQRHVQRDIDRYVATHGCRMTDTLERENSARLLGNGWNFRR
jgi:hypothetical protein